MQKPKALKKSLFLHLGFNWPWGSSSYLTSYSNTLVVSKMFERLPDETESGLHSPLIFFGITVSSFRFHFTIIKDIFFLLTPVLTYNYIFEKYVDLFPVKFLTVIQTSETCRWMHFDRVISLCRLHALNKACEQNAFLTLFIPPSADVKHMPRLLEVCVSCTARTREQNDLLKARFDYGILELKDTFRRYRND